MSRRNSEHLMRIVKIPYEENGPYYFQGPFKVISVFKNRIRIRILNIYVKELNGYGYFYAT